MIRSFAALIAILAAVPAGAAPSTMGIAPPVMSAPTAGGGGLMGGWGGGGRPHRPGERHRWRHGGGDAAWSGGNGSASFGYGLAYEDYPAAPTGFFADGAAFRSAGGGVRYDYDRGYPYQNYRPAARGPVAVQAAETGEPRCTVEIVPGPGGRTEIRVCRR